MKRKDKKKLIEELANMSARDMVNLATTIVMIGQILKGIEEIKKISPLIKQILEDKDFWKEIKNESKKNKD